VIETGATRNLLRRNDQEVRAFGVRILVLEPGTSIVHLSAFGFVDLGPIKLDLALALHQHVFAIPNRPEIIGSLLPLFVWSLGTKSQCNSESVNAASKSSADYPELETFLAEAFLAGLSTRDLAGISGKHLGHKYDSKQISRIVGRATTELEAWRHRSLQGQCYKFLYVDGANFLVSINGHAGWQSFCAVLGGVSEENERFEVLALEMEVANQPICGPACSAIWPSEG
jgi:mutator family transposase